ncbi:hypothetical protein KUCAC02_034341 [Chaenocephalus aceratus]|nr:hypothetical protein KUCAC02_034341 [Chaenocephalus aceratus]
MSVSSAMGPWSFSIETPSLKLWAKNVIVVVIGISINYINVGLILTSANTRSSTRILGTSSSFTWWSTT